MKKAFSLIELLIVILIIGIVYTLAVSKLDQVGEGSETVRIGTLKEYLLSLNYTDKAKILCLDDCTSCDIYTDGKKIKTVEDILDESVVSYDYNHIDGYSEIEKEIYFNAEDVEEDVCFSYEVDTNGVGTQVLVEYKDSFYDFSTYFTKVKKYSSMANASDAKESTAQEVK